MKPGFEIACPVTVNVHDDLDQALQPVKWMLAFYIGGMGARRARTSTPTWCAAWATALRSTRCSSYFFEGKRAEAAAAVPDQFADEISLVGSPARIRERLQAWKQTPITTILAGTRDAAALRVLAEAL